MTSIVPILLLLILAILVIWLIKATFLNGQNRKRLFLAYAAVLFVSSAVYGFLPKGEYHFEMDGKYDGSKQNDAKNTKGLTEHDLFKAIATNKLDELPDILVKETWEFDYDGKQLFVLGNGGTEIPIIVEKKEADDRKIEITYYLIEPSLNGVDISQLIEKPAVQLKENELHIIQPNAIEVIFRRFEKSGVMRQFSDERGEIFDKTFIHAVGGHLLYLKIPRDLTLVEKGIFLEDVENIREVWK